MLYFCSLFEVFVVIRNRRIISMSIHIFINIVFTLNKKDKEKIFTFVNSKPTEFLFIEFRCMAVYPA